MRDALLSAVVLVVILGASALVTNWFARTMYNRCESCGMLKASRRLECLAGTAVLNKS